MKLASIEKILKIEPHPNADLLEIATVLGYQCIVPKGKWNVGDWCVLIQPDTVLPDAAWANFYKSKSNRVKAIKIRGEWSFGIVEDIDIYTSQWGVDFAHIEGEEISERLGVTKYEAPQPQDLTAKGGLPYGICKTDEERYQNLDIRKYIGEKVDITLKVDGQSFTAFYKDGVVGVTGRTMEYKLEYENNFTRNFKKLELEEKLRSYCEKYGVNIALRGEQFGAGIQNSSKNPRAKSNLGVQFFSCWDIDNRRYFSPSEQHYYQNVCEELDLPCVPLLEYQTEFSEYHIEKYEKVEDLFGLLFEGVVVTGEGFSFKIINLYYDSKK